MANSLLPYEHGIGRYPYRSPLAALLPGTGAGTGNSLLPFEHGQGHQPYTRPKYTLLPAAPHPPARTAGPPAPQASPYGGLFTGSLWDQANKLADYVLGPAKTQYQQLSAQHQQLDAQRLAQLQAYISQIASSFTGLPAEVLQAYRGAAQDQSTFAQGFSDAVKTAVQESANQDNTLLSQINAPAGQQISPDQASNVGDVVYGLGGWIPATTLSALGARAYADAAKVPAIIQQRGLGAVSDLLGQQQQDQQALDQAYQQTLAGRPQSVLDFLGQLQQKRAANQSAAQGNVKIVGDSKTGYYGVDLATGKRIQLVPPAASSATGSWRIQVFPNGQAAWVSSTGKMRPLKGNFGKPPTPQKPLVVGSSQAGWTIYDSAGNVLGTKPPAETKPNLYPVIDKTTGDVTWFDKTTGSPVSLSLGAAGGTPPPTKVINGTLVQWDPATGAWKPALNVPDHPTFRTLGNTLHAIWQDPKTGAWKDQVIARGPAAQHVTTHYDSTTGMMTAVDSNTGKVVWRQRTGSPKVGTGATPQPHLYSSGSAWIPSTDKAGNTVWKFRPPPKKAGKTVVSDPVTGLPLSGADAADAAVATRQAIYGWWQKPSTPGGKATLKMLSVNHPLADVLAFVDRAAVPPEIWVPIVRKAYRIPLKISDLKYMKLPRLRDTATFFGWKPDPAHPMDRQGFIDYITGALPKAEAATTAAGTRTTQAADLSKYVYVAKNANRGDVGINTGVIDFVGMLGQKVRQRLQISTGSNHNQYVAGTDRQSQHWTGDAADIPATRKRLLMLGRQALILAGADPAWANKQTGGAWTINGVNILFNTLIGGNHYNHLHVGLTGEAEAAITGRLAAEVQPTSPLATKGAPLAMANDIRNYLGEKGSPFANQAQFIVQQAAKYGIDPRLIVAIAGAESSFGTYGPSQGIHNPFGWGPNVSFPTWQAAIAKIARALRFNYIDKGFDTVAKIQRKWAPVGAANDPTGLNQNWIDNVTAVLTALGGNPDVLRA